MSLLIPLLNLPPESLCQISNAAIVNCSSMSIELLVIDIIDCKLLVRLPPFPMRFRCWPGTEPGAAV
jgi:hypothetical protein